MRNWKTSLFGIITSIAGFIVASPSLFTRWPWVVPLASYVMVGGFAAIGLAAKDSTTHSTVVEVNKSQIEENIKQENKK